MRLLGSAKSARCMQGHFAYAGCLACRSKCPLLRCAALARCLAPFMHMPVTCHAHLNSHCSVLQKHLALTPRDYVQLFVDAFPDVKVLLTPSTCSLSSMRQKLCSIKILLHRKWCCPVQLELP